MRKEVAPSDALRRQLHLRIGAIGFLKILLLIDLFEIE